MKKVISIMLALIMVLSLAGCGGSGDGGSTGEKTVDCGIASEPNSINPHNVITDTGAIIVNHTYEGLVRVVDGEIQPGIAESWEHNEDSSVWTFHLRESTWSDGTPLTAEDFVYSYQRLDDPAVGNMLSDKAVKNAEKYMNGECTFDEVGVTALDDYTIEYVLENPNAQFLYKAAGANYSPMNKDAVEAAGDTYGSEAEGLMSNGPFVCTEWVHDTSITLEKNENYWDADSVKLDKVVFTVGATGSTGVDAMLAGNIDVCLFEDAANIDTLKDSTDYIVNPYRYQFLYVNCAGSDETAAFMSNANFRKALSLAIDRESLMNATNVVGTAAYRITNPALTTEDGKSWDEEYPLEGWNVNGDVEKAKEYLNLALDEIGVSIEDVPEIKLLASDSEANLLRCQSIQDMLLTNLGIKITMDLQPSQQMLDKAYSGNFDLWWGGANWDIPDWYEQVGQLYDITSPYQVSFYDNAEYSALCDQAEAATTVKAREEALYSMEKMLIDDMATIILYWGDAYIMYDKSISNITTGNVGYMSMVYADVE